MSALLKWLQGRQLTSSDVDTAWRQQNKEQQENALFKLVDFTPTGGLLVRAFTEHGAAGVVQAAHEHMSHFLYHGGQRCGRVKRLDYARWLARQQDKIAGTHESDQLSDAELLARHAPEDGKFMQLGEHDACWELSKRGPVGETALHLCFLNDTPVHREIAWTLLDIYPSLALDIYEGTEYYGESSLHFAIVYGDLESVKLLVQKGAKVDQRATGNFFLPEDQKKVPKARHTDYKGYAYYGEYPLSFAASFGLQSIYDYLISEGADPNACDSFGNTALHMAVINNQPSMYTYAVRRQYTTSARADPWMRNKSGYTPLALACKLGRRKMFEEMLEIHSIELWRFSNIHCSLYPLHAIDTIGSSGITNWNSALMIIANEKSEDHLEMLQSRVILQLLDEKWKTFVRKKFFQRFALAIVHLLVLSAAVYLRPDSDVTSYSDAKSIVRLVCEIIVCIVCSLTIIFSLNTLRICGVRHYLQCLANVPSIGLFILACVLLLCCLPLRLSALVLSSSEARHELLVGEETLLVFALPTSWAVMLFFAKAHTLTGDSVLMLYKILRGDMIRFVLIYFIFLMSFSQAFYSLFRNSPATEKYSTFFGTMMSMFLMTLQEYDFTDFDVTRLPALTKVVFILFMFLMPILLLNMLIAMMGETYEKQLRENRSRKDWIAQWAKVVIFLERDFSNKELLQFQKSYSVLRDKPPESDRAHLESEAINGDSEYRALMAIKESSKTKAKQRQGALQNWKAALKRALAAVKAARAAGHPPGCPLTYKDLFPDSRANRIGDLGLPGTPLQRRSTLQASALKAAVDQLSWEWQATATLGSTESSCVDHSRGTVRADSIDAPIHLPPLDEVMGSPSGSSCGSVTPSDMAHRLTYVGQLYDVTPAGDGRVAGQDTGPQSPPAQVSGKRALRREDSHPASRKYL